jgi:hypothetical protein
MKRTAALLAMLMLCACQDRVKLHVGPLPKPPVDTERALPSPMLPDLHCLQTTARPCRGDGSQTVLKSTTNS